MIVLMEQIVISGILAMFGVILGSFAAASVWRLRARQLVEDKAAGEPVDKAEYKKLVPLTQSTVKADRSRCLHCTHPLAWYDLIPLISWISVKGKCRYCHVSIGWFEPLMELGVAVFFVASYLLWPHNLTDSLSIVQFIVWLASGVMLAVLFGYDLKWFLLPDSIVFPLIGASAIFAAIDLATTSNLTAALTSLVGAVTILSGLYFALWHVSKGQWIGFGDVKLGLALALLLVDWRLAFIALFAANLIGCLIVIPGMLAKKITRSSRIPFGPLLIVGAVLAMLCGPLLLSAYSGAIVSATMLLVG
ncbi:MAG: putative Prepilin peptidase [Candidatus Saccharibacteria bacterium]|jgi:prepilin signal peptidase PulO-like enzyme (type II secretory pathway)|nr:putative Prepilin peptidase [Candidatus Saccharibacteria bacterium]